MDKLFRVAVAESYKPEVDEWLSGQPDELYAIARHWFARMRRCGKDVTELLHDGCPVACIGDAAFAYVNVFSSHVNVGFFRGSMLSDPDHLLMGDGKRMRHVKLNAGDALNNQPLEDLIKQAYLNMWTALRTGVQ